MANLPHPALCFRALGALLDFTLHPRGPMMIRPAEHRVVGLLVVLNDVLSRGTLFPSLAGKLYGKVMFLSSQSFGRLGRALLRSFSRRQHEHYRMG